VFKPLRISVAECACGYGLFNPYLIQPETPRKQSFFFYFEALSDTLALVI